MFEKFTQKAIDVVQSAQSFALSFNHDRVLSQHLLLGLVAQTKGVQAKILNFDKINFGELSTEIASSAPCISLIKDKNLPFSKESKEILLLCNKLTQELNSKFTMPQHIALAIFLSKNTQAFKILKKFSFDEEKIIPNLKRILDKSEDIKISHPEVEVENTQLSNINDFFSENTISNILSNAQSKVTTSGYEIMGSEQILQSILDNKDYPIVDILNNFSINSETFAQDLSKFSSRSAEFESSEKKIIFTPNAFNSLLLALDLARESGCVEILPEHIVLGMLKSKKGIAYKILSSKIPASVDFEDVILKKLDDKIPETLVILRLAKEEAISLNCSVIGTEMILLGILSYGTGVASDTLKQLGITLKDARNEVKKLIKPQKDGNITSLSYSPRAKKMLEVAYSKAREHKRKKIKSENLLYGITKMPQCIAMQVLYNLGTDVLEVQQGIKQELLFGMDL